MPSGRPARSNTRVMLLVSALCLAGCVSSADGPSPTEPHGITTTTLPLATTTTLSFDDALTAYVDCLDSEGVTIDEITLDGLGRPRLADAMRGLDLSDRIVLVALERCGPILTSGALDLAADPRLRAEIVSNLHDLADCIRDLGIVDFPDPVPGFAGVGAPFQPGLIPWQDARLSDAVTVCMRDVGRSSP